MEIPFAVAVIVTAVVVVTVPAVALKLAAMLPAATVTKDGIVRAELLSETETGRPNNGAALFRVTVQVVVSPAVNDDGEQMSELTPRDVKAGTVTTPTLDEVVSLSPFAVVDAAFTIWTGLIGFALDDSVRTTVATTPSLRYAVLTPKSKQE